MLNPYDEFAVNTMANDKQYTIIWYVDDNKISHVDKDIISKVIEVIETKFGKITIIRGSGHVILSTHIKFGEDYTVSILIKN